VITKAASTVQHKQKQNGKIQEPKYNKEKI